MALCAICLAISCDNGNSEKEQPTISESSSLDGTKKMVQMLKELGIDSIAKHYVYSNSLRAEMYNKQAQEASGSEQVEYRFKYAYELLGAGHTSEALDELSSLLEFFEQNSRYAGVDNIFKLKRIIALGYLRLGEQQNCIAYHSAESCLLPITGGGVHQIQEPSRNAINYFTEILEQYPDELGSRWLLNVAYMTVGNYPQEVPKKWLIPPKSFYSDAEMPKFNDIAARLGLDVRELSGGCAVEDFNNDGLLDIMASSWGIDHQIRLFMSSSDGTFTEKTKEAGLLGLTSGLNMVHADYDNDGYRDVLILRGGWLNTYGQHPNSLLHNNGDGTFSDVTEEAGLLSFQPTQTACWADFNNDGWLDLFIGAETLSQGFDFYSGTRSKGGSYPCEFYINNKDGTFTNVANTAGIDIYSSVKGVAAGDFDNDGFMDIYLSCLTDDNILLRNNGPGANNIPTFSNVSRMANIQEPKYSFPCWFFDFNNDGWEDIFVSGFDVTRFGHITEDVIAHYLDLPYEAETPRLYMNNGDGSFTDIAKEAHLDGPYYTMGSNFGDIDNDGWLDIYLGTGEPDIQSIVPNVMFRNVNGKFFQNVTTATGTGQLQKGHAIGFGDLDNDGDQDIYAVMGGAIEGDVYQNALFENPGSENHWITLFLQGVQSNRDAIGVRIKIVIQTVKGERSIYNTVTTGGSFGSSSLRQEIGLGDAVEISSIEIFWPATGKQQVFKNIEMDQAYLIVEDKSFITTFELQRLDFSKVPSTPHLHSEHSH
ncbi:MAG: CRTAC1 family protein [Bacteroidetes bacterium]|nr:CRTAC1 family protein [Bacteroidota bacterium]